MIVITFTGYMTTIDTLIKARRAGAFDYLDKSSLNFKALTKEITEALEGKYPFSENFEIEVEDSIYKKYGQTLEEGHKDEFVAINFDGDYILGKDEIEVIEEAVKKFGKGRFILRKIGYDYVYKM